MAKLKGKEHKQFLLEKLAEQQHFLTKSIDGFVAGDLAEAVRIAITIRVLIHETGSSKPLLKQLVPNYLDLEISERISPKGHPPRPGMQGMVVMSVPISITISDKGVFLNPNLDFKDYCPSILGKWWTSSCMILPGFGGVSRKEIVLGLADKEGGAHVDTNISDRYHQLINSEQLQVGWSKDSTSPLKIVRFMAAQSGVELLHRLKKRFSAS